MEQVIKNVIKEFKENQPSGLGPAEHKQMAKSFLTRVSKELVPILGENGVNKGKIRRDCEYQPNPSTSSIPRMTSGLALR